MSRTLKQAGIWSLETLCEALLLTVFLTILWRDEGQSRFADDLGLVFVATLFVFMFGSGYLLTTGIFRVSWRSNNLRAYPVIAALLFVLHVQFFADGWTSATKVPVQMGGACIVAACTFIGNRLLRRWTRNPAATTPA